MNNRRLLPRRVWAPLLILPAVLTGVPRSAFAADVESKPPYQPSEVIAHLHWDWSTLRTAAPGSDLWPVAWLADDSLLAGWGDGGGFGGTDREGRVAQGFARLDGTPLDVKGVNVNGGKDAQHPASFPEHGKVGGLVAVGDNVYGWLNAQNGKWPDVDEVLIISQDRGATWRTTNVRFPKGKDRLKPSTFLTAGRANSGLPEPLKGFVYFYGHRQGKPNETYLGRAPEEKLEDPNSYEYFAGEADAGHPRWSADSAAAKLVFADPTETNDLPTVVYLSELKRYLLTIFHKGPGQLGFFDAPQPWGPWTTVAYYERWGDMTEDGEGLTCSFPPKWTSDDGKTLWCVFAVYGPGAKVGIGAHDRFNVVKVKLELGE